MKYKYEWVNLIRLKYVKNIFDYIIIYQKCFYNIVQCTQMLQ